MKLLFIFLFISITTVIIGQEFEFNYQNDFNKILEETNDSSSSLYYEKLLTRFTRNDSTLTDFEILALLIGFTDSEYFFPYHYLTTEREIYNLNGDRKFNEAIEICDSFLYHVPVSQQALIEKSYSYYKLGNQDSAAFYSWKFRKIMDAMANSGTGLTPENALFALGPADGQNFIRKYLASKIGDMGSTRDEHGNFIDILELIMIDQETGDTIQTELYFQIEHAVNKMFNEEEIKRMNDPDNKKSGRKSKRKK